MPRRTARLTLTIIILFLYHSVIAQLTANFSADKTGGCSPLAASFTNTTTGSSANASYEWSFGNGNTSSQKNTGAIFLQEKTYSVTLTVRDGSQTSTITKTITVYKKPAIDFIASTDKGCLPLAVNFTSNSTAGDGTISSYFWDFGDGTTQQTTNAQVAHSYVAGSNASVSLTVTNSFGCQNTAVKQKLITLLPTPTASFSPDKKVLCTINESVSFTNQSTGPANLIYSWDFGDGQSSTQTNPSHVFATMGSYPVKLIATSPDGCKNTSTQNATINVANYQSDFESPAVACKESQIQFHNKSNPVPDRSVWISGDGKTWDTTGTSIISHSYITTGTYTIRLANKFGACSDTVTKTIDIKGLPNPKGFIADVQGICGAPVAVNFRDTTVGAVKWGWNFERYSYPLSVQSTSQSPSYTFTQDNNWLVTLWVTDQNGCTNSVEQSVPVFRPQVQITTTDNNKDVGCVSLTKKFKIITDEQLTAINWEFGDGYTSTETEPEHTFSPSDFGEYVVRLKYTTSKGCTGMVWSQRFTIFPHHPADFVSETGTTICGNSIVTFKRIPENSYLYDYWLINGQFYTGDYYNRFQFQFPDTGKYTITHVMYSDGCRDTVTKENYITILSPIPKITEVKNTCDGDRGLVTFKQKSIDAKTWKWDFGDGTDTSLTTDQQVMTHHYTKTGQYKAFLTTINGQCTMKDSVYVYVMMKQNPVLSATKTTLCMDEGLNYFLSNLERSSYPYVWVYHWVDSYQYGDGTSFKAAGYDDFADWIYVDPFSGVFKNLEKGKDQVRIVTKEVYFNCLDTSNYIPIKITGAVAGFEITSGQQCFSSPVVFRDTSNGYNTSIQNWQWNFGDGQTQTSSQGGTVSHLYANPGFYNVTLKVTDNSGCTSTTSSTGAKVNVNGPKAAFYTSGTNVELNTTVQFYNTTNNYNSPSTQYVWNFGDGATSTDYYPSHTYTVAGTYTVQLVAKDPATACTDTARLTIVVKNFNSAFSYTRSFISNSSCPPVLVQFNNTSINYKSIKWDFGDGTIVENMDRPSHVYLQPGIYLVKLDVEGANGLSGSYTDSVIIEAPQLQMNADPLHGCTSQTVTMNAAGKKNSMYWWDLGDGQLKQSTDSFTTYNYNKSGIYQPSLMVKDAKGCMASIQLPDKIIIDSLSVAINNFNICTPKEILFNPSVISVGGQGQQFTYHWDFGTGKPADTSNLQTPSFTYDQPGQYTVRLSVQTPYGCYKEATGIVTAYQGLGGKINGPLEICQLGEVQYHGTTLLSGQPEWQWIFHDGTIVKQKDPPAKKYMQPGTYPVQLLVNNNGCIDTLTQNLEVHPNPVISFSQTDPRLCEGSSITITAGGANNFSWSNGTIGAVVIASPLVNTTYHVRAYSDFGCSSEDSIRIRVIHPFQIQLDTEAFICTGNSKQLNTSGAASYQWIGNTSTLNNALIANPVATPLITTSYKVVGKDADQCFTDTATINVVVQPAPTVDAGPGMELLTGELYQLKPITSSDVVKWEWSPSKYLSCTDCASPESRPMEPMEYQLKVTNAFGCTASDTVSIKLLCSESRLFIPSAFTPNNDSKNDDFSIKGQGIRIVNYLRIYNRWGALVFERSNFQVNDQSSAWDGKYKGERVSPGTYVYVTEMSCNEKSFIRKGTVTVVY